MSRTKESIRIVAILGSIRPDNMTSKALGLVADEIRKHPDIQLEVIDPKNLNLSLPGEADERSAQMLQKIVAKATGVILATPEYHGSYSSVIKLVIDNLGFPSVLAGKPVALLGVAAGQIGAIKAIEHLRSVCSHIGAIVLPGVVSIAGVHKYFDTQGRCLDENVEKRVRALGISLIDYIRNHICPRMILEEMVRGDTERYSIKR